MAYVPGTYEGQPLEYRSLSVRICGVENRIDDALLFEIGLVHADGIGSGDCRVPFSRLKCRGARVEIAISRSTKEAAHKAAAI